MLLYLPNAEFKNRRAILGNEVLILYLISTVLLSCCKYDSVWRKDIRILMVEVKFILFWKNRLLSQFQENYYMVTFECLSDILSGIIRSVFHTNNWKPCCANISTFSNGYSIIPLSLRHLI